MIEGGLSRSHDKLRPIAAQLRKCCNHPYLFDGVEPEPFLAGGCPLPSCASHEVSSPPRGTHCHQLLQARHHRPTLSPHRPNGLTSEPKSDFFLGLTSCVRYSNPWAVFFLTHTTRSEGDAGDKLLQRLHANGHKVLLFSQMTTMLDILQDYLDFRCADWGITE